MATFSLYSYIVFPLYIQEREREREIADVSVSSVRTPVLLAQGSTLTSSFHLNDLLKGLTSKYGHTGD